MSRRAVRSVTPSRAASVGAEMPGCVCSSASVSSRRLVVLIAKTTPETRTVTDRVVRDPGVMTEKTLLRPVGLVNSPAFTHVAVVPPGMTTLYVGGQNAVDGEGRLI